MKVRIACFSDTHTMHKRVLMPDCDIAIFAGDCSNRGEQYDSIDFMNWFDRQAMALHKVFIAGNHEVAWDFNKRLDRDRPPFMQQEFLKGNYPNITYLENSSVNIWGINIYGSPYTPDFFPEYWGFNKPRGEAIREEWAKIPDNTDILITHGPMLGELDWIEPDGKVYQVSYPQGHVGCVDLRDRVLTLPNLKLMVCGHIHGQPNVVDVHAGNRTFKYCNAACLDNRYHFTTQPQLITIDI